MTTQTNQPAEKAEAQEQPIVHTPGPWCVAPKNGRVIMAGESKIATAFKDAADPPVSLVNARLIAAVPELLAACREMIEAMGDYECSVDDPPTPKHREMMLRAMKAVEKATYQVV